MALFFNYGYPWTRWEPEGARFAVPTVRVSEADGAALIARSKRGKAVVAFGGTAYSPYLYDVTQVLTGRIPQHPTVTVSDSARVHSGLAPWAVDGGLPNFTDTAGPVWAARVFTPDVARRLQTLSLVYDPDGVLLAARGVRS